MGRRVSPRRSKVVGGSKRMNIMAVRWVFILELSRVGREPKRSFGEKPRVSSLALQRRILARADFEIVLDYFRGGDGEI